MDPRPLRNYRQPADLAAICRSAARDPVDLLHPATLDIDRYRVFAWLAVFPSRTLGTVFFFLAVFVFDQPLGYLAGVFLDGSVGIATLFCLLRILRLEQNIAEGRPA